MNTTEKQLDKQDAIEIKNFTRVPNMLIFGYHDTISPQEKWLLVCLKHLCGKKGTRHLSLRYISEQTGISTGALSASKDKKGKVNEGMIKHLHNAGFIHAEVKKFQGKGNPQYHITITDVWELNQAFFDKTCSDFGQDEEEDVEPVRNSDDPVQISDKLVQISDEPVRNSANTNIRYKTITNTREQEESTDASAIASAAHTHFSSQHESSTDSYSHTALEANEKAGQNGQSNHHQHLGRDASPTHITDGQADRPLAQTGQIVADESENYSHSDGTQANSVAPVPHERAKEIPAEEQKQAPRPQRKPKVLKDAPTPEQIEQVIVCMETTITKLKREEIPDSPDFTFSRSLEARNAVKGLLTGPSGTVRRITREQIEWLVTTLYRKPADQRTGYRWRDHLKVTVICNNFDNQIVNYRPSASRNGTSQSVPQRTVSGKARVEVPDDILEAMIAAGGGY